MNRWFRFYDDAINDPKILKLSDALFRAWVGLLCIASKNAGRFPPVEDIALMLRMKPERVRTALKELQTAELVDEDETGLSPHNWNVRQYKSDVSTPRVKQFRERKRNVSGNGSETPSESETDTEADTEQPSAVEPRPSEAEIPLALDAWNSMAAKAGLRTVQKLTASRRAALAQRLRDGGGIIGWQIAMDRVGASPRLRGERNGRGHESWKCTFDFIVKETNFAKLMEGQYDDRTADDSQSARSRENAAILEGLGIKPDEQRGADTGEQGPIVALGDISSDTPTLTDHAGDPGRRDSQAGGLGQGVQRAGERPENRRRGVPGSSGTSAARSALGSVQSDTGDPQMGNEAPFAERDSRDSLGPTGGTPEPAGETAARQTLPDGTADAIDSAGAPACERDHGPVEIEAGYDRNADLEIPAMFQRPSAA